MSVKSYDLGAVRGHDVFIAEYGVTSYADIQQAIDEKKLVVCYVDEGDEDVICYIYDGANSKNLDHWFHCFNSGASTIKKCVYCKTDSTWHSVEYDYRNVFIARYNETTYDELTTALTTNKVILCVKDNITYEYSGTVSGKAYFSNLSTGSSPLKKTAMLDANGWTYVSYTLLMLNQQPTQYDATKKYNVQRVSASSNQFKLVESTGGGSDLYMHRVSVTENPADPNFGNRCTINIITDESAPFESLEEVSTTMLNSTYSLCYGTKYDEDFGDMSVFQVTPIGNGKGINLWYSAVDDTVSLTQLIDRAGAVSQIDDNVAHM